MRRYGYKRRKNEVHRKERSFHRWLAMFMAAVLMLSESNLTVLAEEITFGVEGPEEDASGEVSMEEADTDNAEDTDDADDTGDTGDEGELPGEEGDDGTDDAGDTDEDNAGSAGDDEDGASDVDDGDGLPGEDNTDENNCVCISKCSEDMVNEDCPICIENYENCGVPESEETGVEIAEDVAAVALSEDEEIETYANGDEFEDSRGIKYKVVRDNQVEVIGHKDGTSVSGKVVIPATVKDGSTTYNVTKIGENAFKDSAISNIEIPNSVTRIEMRAFMGCSLSSIEIPNSVTYIGNEAFQGCYSLSSVEIPNSVTEIKGGAFGSCGSLSSIEIPDSITIIWDGLFEGCSSLSSIKIPNSVTRINRRAFAGCYSLVSIEIPDSVTYIGERAFYRCSNLSSIEIPNSVTDIWVEAFMQCSSLSSIELSNSLTGLHKGLFCQCSSLSSIKIPDSVTSTGSNVFYECSNLSSIELSNNLTDIYDMDFYKCSNLTSIKIPSSVTRIGERVFEYCSNLNTLEIIVSSNETVKVPSVGNMAFWQLPNDRSIVFLAEDGTELTEDALKTAQRAYKSDASDGNANDNFWYGWYLGEVDTTSSVTIKVRKDNSNWTDHTRKFALQSAANPDAELITDLTTVADGQYKIYDITGGTDGDSRIDTGEIITVSSGAGEATVDYYTVTFYDGDIAYAADTPQKAQTVLKGKNASKPTDPAKTGHQFNGWVTENGGSSPFDFEKTTIKDTTSVYADWTADTYSITYHLEGYTASQEDSTYTYGGRTLPAPVKSGYDFDGWHINADYSGEKVMSIGSTETGDKVYYGRWVEKPESAYRVDVKVKRDGGEWKDHGRTFMLLSAADGSLTANFETVKQGDYYIYDVTGVPSESLATDGVNTEVRVSVEDKNVEVTVDYYTVTFYDGDTAYEADTPQAMQTVLGGKEAAEPKAPSKEGYTFNRWMTAPNGSEAFDFSVLIESKSSAYASWISNAATEYYIAASAGEGGSISPTGNVRVQEGESQTFEITPDEDYRIKAVTVDGMDRTDELTDSARARAVRAQAETSRYYTFVDVRESHTIRATFEKESDNTGDSGNTGTGDNTGDSGNTGTGDNTGDSGNIGTGGNGGNSGNTGTGGSGGESGSTGTGGSSGDSDNTDSGDYAVINISNADGAENAGSPAENSNISTTSGDARVINTSTNNSASNPSKDKEPKTGDTSQVEIYATVAMIAGLTYLLLYFADKEKGMTEEKKEELVASMIGWAKRGRRIRKYIVLVPIFILLCYYHSIGKRIEVEWDEEPVWAEL